MKKVFWAIVAFVVVSSMSAQDKKFWFGGEAGVGVSKVLCNCFIDDLMLPKLGFDLNGKIDYQFLKWMSLESGIGYQRLSDASEKRNLSFNSQGGQDPVLANYDGGEIQHVWYYHSLRVPLSLKIIPVKRFSFSIGLLNQFLLSRVSKVKGLDDARTSHKASEIGLNTYIPSVTSSLGFDILSKESFKLNINGFFEYSTNALTEKGTAHFQYYGLRTAVMF